ncbi:hypothetical protein AJ78_00528 [Emergomyces pasteurianus Ep9510]|uniref:DUF7730 domain-containing protein n=1 Tax=Emergomyces pasteurianus Ep9510 TaxID=1447872 RepID=A0A1J9QUL3_9EURO|nr:hypothetical protein AJ78_00528 [Emergomyces pasteurianus Ep9510]
MRVPVFPFSNCGEVSEDDSDERRTDWLCCWLLCPVILCIHGYFACRSCCFRNAEAKHHERQITEASIPALPKRRPRNLSLTTPSGPQPSLSSSSSSSSLSPSSYRPSPGNPFLFGRKSQAAKLDNQASALFFKLSPELRQIIYREVLSGYEIAVVRIRRSCPETKDGSTKGKAKPGRLSHLKYPAETEEGKQSIQHPSWLRRYFGIVGICPSPLSPDFEANEPGEQLLPLVKSCRRMQKSTNHRYLEAIDLLYSSNTFHFYHEDDFLAFSNTILTQRLNVMSSIHLHFFPGYYNIQSSNYRISTIISAMRNLKRLDISFMTILSMRRAVWFDDTNDGKVLLRKLQEFEGNVPIALRLGLPTDRLLALVESALLPSNVQVVKLDLPLAAVE